MSAAGRREAHPATHVCFTDPGSSTDPAACQQNLCVLDLAAALMRALAADYKSFFHPGVPQES